MDCLFLSFLSLVVYHCRPWKPTWHPRTVTGSTPTRWGQTHTLRCTTATHSEFRPECHILSVIRVSCAAKSWTAHEHLSGCRSLHFIFVFVCLGDWIFIWYGIIALPITFNVRVFPLLCSGALHVWHWPKWSFKVAVTAQIPGSLWEYRAADSVFSFVLHFHWFKVIWR